MAGQLDILALEPFYGGVRKQTLDLLSRHSRHRWTIYKLPARRLERRLNTAAQWFTQQLARVPDLKCDVLFSSDAMNLADFMRLNPDLGRKPSVAYYYCNQLAGDAAGDQQARLAMLGTATSATEIWFNSMYHMRETLGNAAALFDGHKELGGREPLRALIAKSQLMHPPVEIVPPAKDANIVDADRKGRTICFDNREGADPAVYSAVLKEIVERKEPVLVHVLGRRLEAVPEGIPTAVVDARHDEDVLRTMRRCELYISSQSAEQFDPIAMRAMALGCIPILRRDGYNAEFLPAALHSWCLYDGAAQNLLSRIMDLWYLHRPAVARRELDAIFSRYTPMAATKGFDKRLEYLFEQQQI